MQSLYSTLSTPVRADGLWPGRTQETKAIETVDGDRVELAELFQSTVPHVPRGETITTFTKETVDNDQEADGLWPLVDFDRR
jgi:hypothetical protein